MYVLGIDGGGTTTKGVIASSIGEVIAEATVGATNPNSISTEGVKEEFEKLFSLLSKQNKTTFSQVKRIFAGMSGVDNAYSKDKMSALITSLIDIPANVSVDNDAITALYSGTLGKPGVVQIAGTGSITYGLNRNGDRGRVGGWGYLIGEKGSGFALGRDGLDAAFLAHDGIKDATEISKLLLEYFHLHSLPNIIQPVYQGNNVKEGIASLSKLVIEACDNGDSIAQTIVQENSLHMGESIVCLVEKLFSEEECQSRIPIVVTGGLFNRLDLFQPFIEKVIYDNKLNLELVVPKIEPVGGAVVAALQRENINLNPDFIERFIETGK